MKANELQTLEKRRKALEERILKEKLKVFENFTNTFLEMFDCTVDDIPSSKKACVTFIQKALFTGGYVFSAKKEELTSTLASNDAGSATVFVSSNTNTHEEGHE